MADTTFVNNVTLTDSDWFNDLNRLHYTILGDPADASAVRNTLGISPSFGLTLSNNTSDATNDIDIAAGARWNTTRTLRMSLAAGVTRQLDVAFGTGNGGQFDTAIANGTWHVFLISNGTLVNVGFSQSLDPTGTANYPSGYTSYRRIGSILRESGVIVPFDQYFGLFQRKSPIQDVAATSVGTSAVLRTLSVPDGIRVIARMNAGYRNTSGVTDSCIVYFSDPACDDLVPSVIAAPGSQIGDGTGLDSRLARRVDAKTNTSRQVRTRAQVSGASYTLYIVTEGWFDEEIMEP